MQSFLAAFFVFGRIFIRNGVDLIILSKYFYNMSKNNKFNVSTLEYYNYGEYNKMEPATSSCYSVKVSDKDGNIITIEKDNALYAMVSLSFDSNDGMLRLLDVAHDDSVLAEIEMPNAEYIYNCRFDESKNSILFDVKSLYGKKTSTIELDVEDLIELYEAGQGIEIGEKNQETGRKPISVKLAEGENILQLSDEGLSIDDDKVVTIDELEAALSGKADITYVDELVSGCSGVLEAIEELSGQVETNRDDIAELDDEIGELSGKVDTLSGDVESLGEKVDTISGDVDTLEEEVDGLKGDIEELSGKVETISGDVDSLEERVDALEDNVEAISGDVIALSGEVEANKVKIELVTDGLEENVREEYILTNTAGTQLGETIKIYKDSSLKDAEFVTVDDTGKEGQFLKLTYILSNGEEKIVYVDMSLLVAETEFGDGLEVIDGVAKVKVDPESDSYITVSPNGVKISGIAEFLAALVDINRQQWDAINQNRIDLEGVDAQLWRAIALETSARTDADTTLQSNIDVEEELRKNADRELGEALSAETDARISGDTRLENLINEKVNAEKNRAQAAEDRIASDLAAEIRRSTSADTALGNRIDGEIEDRQREDNNIRIDINTKYRELGGRIDGVIADLGAEARTREEQDGILGGNIQVIMDTYATKEYVDAQDNITLNDAVSSATTVSNAYTDAEVDALEVELKQYCDSGHTELQRAISDNATKINVISNLNGVTGSDASNYDDSGNGILDVLHKEFHQLTKNIGAASLEGLLADMLRRIEALEQNPPGPGPSQPGEASEVGMDGYPEQESGVVTSNMSVLDAISALENAVIDNELTSSAALNDLNTRLLRV